MEKDPVTSEEEKEEESSENGREKMKEWFTENLRMIVSVLIVVAIAGGIYAYSKRTQAPTSKKITSVEENSEGKINIIGGETESSEKEQPSNEKTEQQQNQSAPDTQATETQISQETENSFVETAAKGEGTTHLARRALANYLEKNPDSTLTAEHKIYIEDFLRRQVKDGHLKLGDKREFSKDMIANAIQKAKGLNEKQLKNLQKYAQKVPSLN